MPTKKKKYNARFPPARIKKIMQKDEEVGKVASTVPVMLSRLLELFTESLILKTNELTLSVNARTLTTSHLKQVILSERKFDFLKDLVAHIPDVQANDEDGGDSNSEQGNRPRPRGRPRKKKDGEVAIPKKPGRKPKVVVPLQEDALEEDNSDSETEDADSNENEDPESTSEDATCDRSMEEVTSQVQKRRRVDDSAAATTSSFHELDSQPQVPINDNAPRIGAEHRSSSADLLTADSKSSIRETLPPQSSVALLWGSAANFDVPSVEQTASETCLPLNLKTAAATKDTNPTTNFGQDLETYLLQQQQQELHRAVGLNFGKTSSYHPDAGVGGSFHLSPGLGLLAPPPAHQPISQALRHPLASSCLMQTPFPRSNMLCPTASEFSSRVNSSVIRDNTSPSVLCPVLNSSGHAVHRMPVVPSSFPGPGAVLARSTSVPHGTGVALKPSSSLVTFPDDDYDS